MIILVYNMLITENFNNHPVTSQVPKHYLHNNFQRRKAALQ